MKPNNNKTGLLLGMFAFCSLTAQVDTDRNAMNPGSDQEIVSETTEKTYQVVMGDKVIRNSVSITTLQQQDIKLEDEEAGKVNLEREFPKKEIVKIIKIDNDADDDYDEQIRFRYKANASSDFALVTDGDEIVLSLEDGENLQILDAQSIRIKDAKAGNKSFIFTEENGAEIEFFIDEYKDLDQPEGM